MGVLEGVLGLADALPVSEGHDPALALGAGFLTRAQRRLALARRPLRLSAAKRAYLERVVGGMCDFNRIVSASAPRGRLVELGGIVATVMPDVPERSVMNAVVYEQAGALAAGLEELAATYDEAGVDRWLVWVPAVDGQARRVLKRAGHRLDASPVAMAADLNGVGRPPRGALEHWTADGDPALMAAVCDRAFLFGTAFSRALSGLPPHVAHVYLATVDGEPVSCVLTSDQDGNCAVNAVATVPEAQGRGLSTALVGHALADARERGCTTTTLVATPRGRPVYQRLGYHAVCPIQQWERRDGNTR
jgi:GNAT superfamily N-acetyltransferase